MLNFRMIKTIHIFLLLILSTTLLASEDGSGFYMGVGVGSTAYIDSEFAKAQVNKNVTEEVSENATGVKVYGGYQVNSIIGVEATYIYYGAFKVNDDYTYTAQGVSLSTNVGYSFLTGQLRPYILLGLGYVYSDFPHRGIDVADQSPTLHIGFGMDYAPEAFGGIGIRGAYESNSFSYKIEEGTPEEKKYIQGFGALYIGCFYKF